MVRQSYPFGTFEFTGSMVRQSFRLGAASVKDVAVPRSTGTTFLISKNRAITNAHLVCDKYKILNSPSTSPLKSKCLTHTLKARFQNSSYFEVSFLAIDTSLDLAILQVPEVDKEVNIPPPCEEPLLLGQLLFLLGNPGGFMFSVKFGRFSCLRFASELLDEASLFLECENVDIDMEYIEVDRTSKPGMSGCPIFYENGSVVGVLVGWDARSSTTLAVSFSIVLELDKWASMREPGSPIYFHGEIGYDSKFNLNDDDDDD
ncbi:hypothetical protein Vadar_023004 [Vaccinium darrowii]|uniref:Uncharacterized protein n=1 Tax=Vaccinium darrowii TaxID=229202 RepID=A0ACB7ZM23_9ERIC|nr:hypothetical protein Vadar_023004 [Vaccinium darrowii]